MGSLAHSVTKTADQRTALETAEIGQFGAPDSMLTNPGAVAGRTGDFSTLHQTVTGLTGADVNALATSIFADEQADQTAVADLAKTALTSMQSLASQSQAAGTPDWNKWLPYVVVGAVLLMFLGMKK